MEIQTMSKIRVGVMVEFDMPSRGDKRIDIENVKAYVQENVEYNIPANMVMKIIIISLDGEEFDGDGNPKRRVV
jgi:hypothetical protein